MSGCDFDVSECLINLMTTAIYCENVSGNKDIIIIIIIDLYTLKSTGTMST